MFTKIWHKKGTKLIKTTAAQNKFLKYLLISFYTLRSFGVQYFGMIQVHNFFYIAYPLAHLAESIFCKLHSTFIVLSSLHNIFN